ncbi:MAG: hypothetical protein K2X86_06530 [Cytophagaceae bacterium]|nr:hypothetical protein [Cytophagaceae bacterium]
MKNLKFQIRFLKGLVWLSIPLLVVSFSSCEKEDVKKDVWKRTIRTQKSNTGMSSLSDPYTAIEGATVYIYGSESNYLMKTNPIHQGTTDANGNFTFEEEYNGGNPPKVWIWAEKSSLNSLRYDEEGDGYLNRILGNDRVNLISVPLAPTPVRLQLNIIDNGAPVENAQVQLYLSESDYLANRIYSDTDPEFDSIGGYGGPNYLIDETNVNGEALFWALEPRKYWFRVTYQSKSNNTTTYYLDTPLADDPNITTVRSVAIQ